jgi:mannosyltransferase
VRAGWAAFFRLVRLNGRMVSGLVRPRTGTMQRLFRSGTLPVRVLAGLFGVLGVCVAAAGSWVPSLWGDEAATVMSAERSWPSLFRMLGHIDAVHGTYYAFMHVWIDVFGASAFSVRLPSAIATGCAAAGIIVLVTRLGGRQVAVVSALAYLLIPRVTYMSGESREYALSAACAVWLTVVFVQLVSARNTRWFAWLGYALLFAASVYVFLYLALMAFAHAVILVSVTRERRILWRWLVATALGIALAGPVIFFAVAEIGQIAFLSSRVTVGFTGFFVGQWFFSESFAAAAWICVFCALAAFAIRNWRRRRTTTPMAAMVRVFSTEKSSAEKSSPEKSSPGKDGPSLAVVAVAWAAVPTGLLLTANTVHALYAARYLSFVMPAIALLIGSGICLLARRWMIVAAVGVLVALSVPTYLHQRGPYGMPGGSDWSEVAATIAQNAHRGDAIVFTEGGSPSQNPRSALYLYPSAFRGLTDATLVTPHAQSTGLWDVTEPVSHAAERLARGNGRVWLVLHRGAGTPVHPLELAGLGALGYTVARTIPENHDVVYLMTNASSSR